MSSLEIPQTDPKEINLENVHTQGKEDEERTSTYGGKKTIYTVGHESSK